MFGFVRIGRSMLVCIGLLLLIVCASEKSDATVLRFLSAQELVKEANEVVHGRVTSVEPHWTKNMKAIYTEVIVEVIEVFKGETRGAELTFTFLGGELEGVRLFYENQPTFAKDEEVLVFLRKRPNNGHLLLMALSQGVWRVMKSGNNNLDTQFQRNLRGIQSVITMDGSIGNFDPRKARSVHTASELRKLISPPPAESQQNKEVR